MGKLAKRVLIVRCGALGDLVYSTSVVDALLYEYGKNTIIDFITTPSNANLFEKDFRINSIFLLRHKKIPIFFSTQKRDIIKTSKNNPYDILINFEMGKQFKGLVAKIVAKKKAGFFCEDIQITKTHVVEICKEFYASVVSSSSLKKAYPRLMGANFAEIKTNFVLPEKYIVFNPSNSHNKKKGINYRAWPHEKWKELINLIPTSMQVVIIGAKGEEHFFEPLKPYKINVIDLVGKLSITQMISVVENAKAVVSTDTGAAHIASAVNTPVFCLIGPTPAEQTGPYRTPFNKVHIINAKLKCSPCYKTDIMRACKDNICMKKISSNRVFNEIKKIILL